MSKEALLIVIVSLSELTAPVKLNSILEVSVMHVLRDNFKTQKHQYKHI